MDNKEFLHYVNSMNSPEALSAPANLHDIIRKEIPFADIYPIFSAAKQSNIKVKEILLESEIDFVNSAKQLKQVFDAQLTEVIDKVNDLYERELLNLQTAYRKNYFGTKFLELVNVLNENEFSLVMMNKRVYAYRYYDPFHDVTKGHYRSGVIYSYDEPVCLLKGVYVNLLHPKITNGTVLISTDDRHPNASNAGLSEACVGDLENHEIPINDPQALLNLLEDICAMYEICHLDSAYFTPEQSYETKQGDTHKWTA